MANFHKSSSFAASARGHGNFALKYVSITFLNANAVCGFAFRPRSCVCTRTHALMGILAGRAQRAARAVTRTLLAPRSAPPARPARARRPAASRRVTACAWQVSKDPTADRVQKCLPGEYSAAAAASCLTCPVNMWSYAGAQDCYCNVGYYAPVEGVLGPTSNDFICQGSWSGIYTFHSVIGSRPVYNKSASQFFMLTDYGNYNFIWEARDGIDSGYAYLGSQSEVYTQDFSVFYPSLYPLSEWCVVWIYSTSSEGGPCRPGFPKIPITAGPRITSHGKRMLSGAFLRLALREDYKIPVFKDF